MFLSLILGLSVFLSTSAFAQQTEFFPHSISHMEEGIRVTDELYTFISSRPCEVGLIEGCDGPMSRQDIETLKNILITLKVWKTETLDNYLEGLDVFQEGRFQLVSGKKHEATIQYRFNSSKLKMEKYLRVTYNPSDVNSQIFSQEVRISTGMGLVLYDSFLKLAEFLSKAKKIRSLLEYDIPEGKIVTDTYKLVMNKTLWNKMEQGVEFLKEEDTLGQGFPEVESARYYEQYISKSFTADQIKNNDKAFRLKSIMLADNIFNRTRFFESVDRFVWNVSKFFGNTVGKFQSRDGKLKKLATDPLLMTKLKEKLRPLDILFEKTPFRLTDYFIPGYFGHVAIWLGTPKELEEMEINYNGEMIPLLSHPDVLPHLERISQGKLVIEALRKPGVTMNTFEHFLDVDDLLVVRSSFQPNNIPELILRTLKQVGKPYDFNFDVETDRAIVCSELAYIVFDEHDWPTSRSMGRYTISPDHIAWRALEDEFHPIMLFLSGNRIEDERMSSELQRVLSLPGGISQLNRLKCHMAF